MQDAVNPIESLDTWTEFVEGKNKVQAARERKEVGRLCHTCVYLAGRASGAAAATWVTFLHILGCSLPACGWGQAASCSPDEEAEPIPPKQSMGSRAGRGWGGGQSGFYRALLSHWTNLGAMLSRGQEGEGD